MDRRSLLALFNPKARAEAIATGTSSLEPPPDAVYEAARLIRGRIDAALAASRLEDPPARAPR